MDRYVVVGNPVEHSQSPFIQAEFARQTGQVMTYGRLRCAVDGFAAAIRQLAADGTRGCNVTVPFKLEAFGAAAAATGRAGLAQAANVLSLDPQGWRADNTDGVGLVNDVERNAGLCIAGRGVLLIGAGGAAAGALGALLAARPAAVVVANRSVAKAAALVERHLQVRGTSALRAAPLDDCGTGHDLIVNATATSLQGLAVPVSPAVLGPDALAVDMMYGPAAAPFLAWAATHGAQGRDGLGMLVEQAAAAFEWWRGVRPDTAPVLAALRARMNAAATGAPP